MSNTSTVTPYENSSSDTQRGESSEVGAAVGQACAGAVIAGVGLAVAGGVALAQWLADESPEEKQSAERARALRRQNRLSSARADLASARLGPARIATAGLHVRQPETLVQAAASLGFRTMSVRLDALPASAAPGAPILLANSAGERMAILVKPSGGVTVHAAGGMTRIESLVRLHTVQRVQQHLQARGYSATMTTRQNGEVGIQAREAHPVGATQAKIEATVRTNGVVDVDIDCVKGSRCEVIVNDLASAVGGRVSGQRKKDAYFQLPGELAKARVKV